MPIYEYQCESCEQRTEAIQRIDEPPLSLCPHCGGPLVKLMSAPSFQFKGSGWYVTDYGGAKGGSRDADKESTAKSETSSSSSTPSSSTPKSESKSSGGSDSASSKTSS